MRQEAGGAGARPWWVQCGQGGVSWLSWATGRLPGLCGGDRSGSPVVSSAAEQEGENGRGGEPGCPCRSPGRTGATGAVVVVVGGLGGRQQEKWQHPARGPAWAELRIAGLPLRASRKPALGAGAAGGPAAPLASRAESVCRQRAHTAKAVSATSGRRGPERTVSWLRRCACVLSAHASQPTCPL